MNKAMREIYQIIEREGFVVERIRQARGSHKMLYVRHATTGSRTAFPASSGSTGDPRAMKNLAALLRRSR
ncbi:MAG TPA: hypothetical protein VI229_00280 [Burkholderiales bacterium]